MYTKCIYKEYTDQHFTHEIPKPAWQGNIQTNMYTKFPSNIQTHISYAKFQRQDGKVIYKPTFHIRISQTIIHDIPRPAWQCNIQTHISCTNFPSHDGYGNLHTHISNTKFSNQHVQVIYRPIFHDTRNS